MDNFRILAHNAVMDAHLSDDLHAQLRLLEQQGQGRQLRVLPEAGPYVHVHGRRCVNLASNDYLGLSQHPALKDAAIEATRRYGTGAGASRLVSGHLAIHEQVEQRFAAFKHAQAALLFPTGYMANLAVLTSLAQRGDLICLDKLDHASLIDAARLSGATVRTFPHLQPAKLERLLQQHLQQTTGSGTASPDQPSQGRQPRRLILTDSVFSMDGDVADLPALCELAERYQAMLIVDEAHGTGVLGETGAGLCEAQGVADRVDVVVSTASKALGGLGGIVTGRRVIIDTLINTARPFIYTTAMPPAQAATIGAALDIIRDEPWRRERLLTMAGQLRERLVEHGWRIPGSCDGRADGSRQVTPILPLLVGEAQEALALAGHLLEAGFLTAAIRPPTVPPGTARLRLSLRADIEPGDLDGLFAALSYWQGR